MTDMYYIVAKRQDSLRDTASFMTREEIHEHVIEWILPSAGFGQW